MVLGLPRHAANLAYVRRVRARHGPYERERRTDAGRAWLASVLPEDPRDHAERVCDEPVADQRRGRADHPHHARAHQDPGRGLRVEGRLRLDNVFVGWNGHAVLPGRSWAPASCSRQPLPSAAWSSTRRRAGLSPAPGTWRPGSRTPGSSPSPRGNPPGGRHLPPEARRAPFADGLAAGLGWLANERTPPRAGHADGLRAKMGRARHRGTGRRQRRWPMADRTDARDERHRGRSPDDVGRRVPR